MMGAIAKQFRIARKSLLKVAFISRKSVNLGNKVRKDLRQKLV